MTVEERKAYIDKKEKEREKYQKRITELDQQRRHYITQKIAENPEENTLDAAMLKIIRDQASQKNYKFE
jgi:hypothetical protein